MVDDKTLVERLRVHAKLDHDTEWFMDAEWFIASAVRPMVLDSARAAKTIERLTRERDEARAALAQARNDALEEAATWHDYESLMNRAEAGQRGRTDSDYWHFDGLADRHQAYAAAIRAMKREPADD